MYSRTLAQGTSLTLDDDLAKAYFSRERELDKEREEGCSKSCAWRVIMVSGKNDKKGQV